MHECRHIAFGSDFYVFDLPVNGSGGADGPLSSDPLANSGPQQFKDYCKYFPATKVHHEN